MRKRTNARMNERCEATPTRTHIPSRLVITPVIIFPPQLLFSSLRPGVPLSLLAINTLKVTLSTSRQKRASWRLPQDGTKVRTRPLTSHCAMLFARTIKTKEVMKFKEEEEETKKGMISAPLVFAECLRESRDGGKGE